MQKAYSIGSTRIKIDDSALKLLKEQIAKNYRVRVGILGNKTDREALQEGETHNQYKKRIRKQKYTVTEKAPVTNAEIGLAMEKGIISRNVPARSWLEQPLIHGTEKLFKVTKKLGALILNGEIVVAYKLLGIQAEVIIQEAFGTGGGPGNKWAPLKYREGSPLIDTGQLRKSVSSQVVTA